MASSRRLPGVPQQPQQLYSPVPTNSNLNSNNYAYDRQTSPPTSPPPSSSQHHQYSDGQHLHPADYSDAYKRISSLGRRDTAHGVARGDIGGGFGPYAHHQVVRNRDSEYSDNDYTPPPSSEELAVPPDRDRPLPNRGATTLAVPNYVWDGKDTDPDDALHNPDPVRDARLDRSFDPFSLRGWMNFTTLFLIITALVLLFAGYPVIQFFTSHQSLSTGFNLGGTNASGQVPDLPGMRGLIDKDTPDDAKSRTGFDGEQYTLVFSDEFNEDGRTFYAGDDPYWEAVDIYYWPTVDLEWYSPTQVTTKNGALLITMEEVLNHNLNFRSGMLQSWNKFCFTTGYIEVSISLPGSGDVPGNWAAAWTMGNLGRPGYGATTDGMWPYTYDSCDVGTYPNQTDHDGSPAGAHTGDPRAPTKGSISFLPGQRASACTCPGGDHPGPSNSVGRGVPEIDIIEAQVDIPARQGQASQSNQVAPFNAYYEFVNTSSAAPIYNPSTTAFNGYKGGSTQQAISAVSLLDNQNYNNQSFQHYGFEYWSDPKNRDAGYITWAIGDTKMWTMNAAAIGPDTATGINQRLVSEEPMAIILNYGMSPGFQGQDFANLKFPSTMYIDYVRVYQRSNMKPNVGCNPSNYPTSDYINNHLPAYNNPNFTTWKQAGYDFPRNSLFNGC